MRNNHHSTSRLQELIQIGFVDVASDVLDEFDRSKLKKRIKTVGAVARAVAFEARTSKSLEFAKTAVSRTREFGNAVVDTVRDRLADIGDDPFHTHGENSESIPTIITSEQEDGE